MTIEIKEITDEEFEIVKRHFFVKATDLSGLRWVSEPETGKVYQVMAYKKYSKMGLSKSQYLKAVIDGKNYVVVAGRVMKAVVTEVLLEAAKKYPISFGSYNAHSILQAIDNIESSGCPDGDKDCIEKFYGTEQFAYVFEVNSDGSINEQVLRLDLFRLIQPSKVHEGGFDFTGGLLHLFKHFRCDECHLGTYPSSHDLNHPTDIIGIIIKCFFQSPHRQIEGEKYFTTLTKLDDQSELLCSFFPTGEINVYFLNTGYFPGKKL